MMTQQKNNSESSASDFSSTILDCLERLNASTNHMQSLESLHSDLCARYNALRSYIVSIDPLTSTLNLESTWGEGWNEQNSSRIINLEDYVCEKVAAEGNIICGNTGDVLPEDKIFFNDCGSVLAFPVILEEKLGAIVVIYFEGALGLSEGDIREVTRLAPVFAIAIRNIYAAKEVEISRAEWFQTFQSLPDGIAIARDDQVIRRCNKAFMDLIGIPREQLIGLSLNQLLSLTFDDHGAATRRFEVNESTKTGNFIEFKDNQKDQTFVLNLTPTINNGHFAWLFVLRNMTEQRAIEAQLIQSDKLAALGEMIAGVAHEINNPLTTVMGQAELLGLSKDLTKAQKSSKLILHEAHRAARIVKNLLIFSRAHQPEKVPVLINELIDQTLELWNYQIKVNNIVIEKHYSTDTPSILVDYYQIQQVIFNLIQNSQQAIATEKKQGVIRIETEVLNDRFVRIIFEDNGPGIEAENLKKIFNPFFTTKSVGKGTGLGLSITYGIITAHGGNISCQSEPGKGTSFIVDLPIEPEGTPIIVDTEETELPSLPSKKIIIIDDETGILNFIQESLQNKGHEILTFTDGHLAIDYVKHNPFDVIFCDIKMPTPSGVDIFKILSEENRNKMIFITGDLVNEETKKFVEDSGRPCVLKPFTTAHLLKALLQIEKKS